MTIGGSAQPIAPSDQPPDGGPALRVAVVSDGRPVIGGPSQPVVVVSDGRPTQGNTPVPVVYGSGPTMGGTPIPIVVVGGVTPADPELNNPNFIQQDTAFTSDMGPDGYNWAQSGVKGPLVRDAHSKLIAISEDAGGNHAFTYSNDEGTTWADSLSLGFLTRGAIAYNSTDDTILVLWSAQAATDGILFRRYTISRDGSNNITGMAAAGAGYTILDAQTTGTMQYEHPAILWLPDQGAHGTVVCVWCARNTGVGGTGNEIRAVRRTLTNDANDLLVANWIHLGVASATTIGNAPLAASYTALLANTTTGIPHVAIARLSDDSLFVAYHDGTVTNVSGVDKMQGNWVYRRVPWNGSNWTPLGAPVTLSALVRSGTNAGYTNKGELLSKVVEDSTGNVYVGLATWKDNTDGDTWGFAQITPGNTVTLVDDYSAGGAASYAPTGDIDIDPTFDCLIDAYITTPDQDVYVRLFDGVTPYAAAELAFDATPCDIPTIYSRAVDGKLCFLFRDTNTPHLGWFGTMDWSAP